MSKKRAITIKPHRQGEDLTPDQVAAIWVLAEEGNSQRDIARQIGCSAPTVGRHLAKNPVAYEALVARLKEERSKAWARLRNRTLEAAQVWTDRLLRTGKKAKLTEADHATVLSTTSAMRASGMLADRAEKMHQLLTGGATERVESTQTTRVEDYTADQIIQIAIESGSVDKLPPGMRAEALRRINEKRGPGLAEVVASQ